MANCTVHAIGTFETMDLSSTVAFKSLATHGEGDLGKLVTTFLLTGLNFCLPAAVCNDLHACYHTN